MARQSKLDQAERIFRRAGGILRTREALRRGIHPRTLYTLRDAGRIEALTRGVYHLLNTAFSAKVDVAVIAARCPHAVICLASALSWHEITTQLPPRVQIAIPPHAKPPRLQFPTVQVFRFSGRAYAAGVERHVADGIPVRVYSVAKTVTDCFKFRNRVGMDVALEALRDGWRERRFTMDELWQYAEVCRVTRVMMPYLESLV